MIHVYTNNRDTVLYTKSVKYVAEIVENDTIEEPLVVMFVEFVANNGPGRGLKQRVPLTKVDAIVNAIVDAEASADENAAMITSIKVSSFRDDIESGKLDEYLKAISDSIAYRRTQVGGDE
jgi:hypothetical protein